MRLPIIPAEEYSPRQQELAARIAGKRGQVRGPFLMWLHSPELCDRVESLGAYVRFDCSLPEKLREFSILITARHWDAQHSWNAHLDKAIAAGLDPAVPAALAARRTPGFKADDERVFYEFSMQMLERHFVDEKTFREAEALFGRQGVIDIIGCLGNFSMLAMLLNACQVDLDPSKPPPFEDVRGYGKVSTAAR